MIIFIIAYGYATNSDNFNIFCNKENRLQIIFLADMMTSLSDAHE